jgi:diguanylate cyclase (GGDEF)-like protein
MAVAREGIGIESVVGLGTLAGSQLIAVINLTSAGEPAPAREDHRLPELAAELPDAILRFDGRLLLREWNAAAEGLLGLDAASAGDRLEDLLGIALNELPLPDGPLSFVGGVGGLRIGLLRSGDGLTAVIRDHAASPEVERLGRELRGTIEELLQARRTVDLQRHELERASTIDALTGVTSRSAILARLRTEVAQARRYQHPVAVVLLDLDDFAAINRAHGTSAGDNVLREVALRIRLRVREADELGRVGSDAFLAVLPHTEESGAATFADALQHRLGLRPIAAGDEQIIPTASVGVAVMRPGDDLDVDALLARADEALASAKRAGGDRIALDRLHGLARLEDRHDTERPDRTDAV